MASGLNCNELFWVHLHLLLLLPSKHLFFSQWTSRVFSVHYSHMAVSRTSDFSWIRHHSISHYFTALSPLYHPSVWTNSLGSLHLRIQYHPYRNWNIADFAFVWAEFWRHVNSVLLREHPRWSGLEERHLVQHRNLYRAAEVSLISPSLGSLHRCKELFRIQACSKCATSCMQIQPTMVWVHPLWWKRLLVDWELVGPSLLRDSGASIIGRLLRDALIWSHCWLWQQASDSNTCVENGRGLRPLASKSHL